MDKSDIGRCVKTAESTENANAMKTAQEEDAAPAEDDPPNSLKSDLASNQWSVISFDGCIESGLTYDQAAAKMALLSIEHVAGLCIVTDKAAAEIGK